MAIKIAQTKTGTSTLASTVITLNNNTVIGNTIVVGVAANLTTDVSGITDTQGNTYVKAFAAVGTGIGAELWYAQNIIGTAAPTITIAYTSAPTAAAVAQEYSGIDTITVLDKTSTGAGGSTALDSGSTPSTTQGLEILIGLGGLISGTVTAGGNFVNLTQQSNATINVAIEDLFVTTAGTYNATFTGTPTGQWACGIATFRASPQGTTTSTSSVTTSTSSSSTSASSTSVSGSSTSNSTSSTSSSTSTSSTSSSISSTSSSTSSTSISSTSSSTSISSTSSSISSTSQSSTSRSTTSQSTSQSSTSSSFSSTSSSISSTSASTSSTSASSTSSSSSTSTTVMPANLDYTYQDTLTLPTSGADDIDPDTNKNVQNVGSDDADYFVQYGSEFMVQEYKKKWINNTAIPTFTWKGRSTLSCVTSPMYFQIFNQTTSVPGTTIDSYSESNFSFSAALASTMTTKYGESFTGNGKNIGNAIFYLGKTGLPTGNAVAVIYSHTGTFGTSSLPGSVLATSDTFDVSTLTTSNALATLTFSGVNQINLVNGTNYVLTIEYSGGDGSNFLNVGADNTSPTFAGNGVNNGSGSFAANTFQDLCFYVSSASILGAWETLAVNNKTPADTDFQQTVRQISNPSNYYDSNNIVTFRTYQQVI